MYSYKIVKEKCVSGRFFKYDDWRDHVFVPISIYFVWIFVNLKFSGNFVSYLSGFITIIGSIMLASNDKLLILIGSFSYIIFYLFDYVDGGVSRFENTAGLGGQYIDWLMHIVSSLSIFIGIFIGAFVNFNNIILPFGILTLIGVVLSLDKYSFAWFTICMKYQQVRFINFPNMPICDEKEFKVKNRNKFFVFFKRVSIILFHENYLIFSLPFISILNYFFILPDFRIVFIFLGGLFLFPITIIDINYIANSKKIDESYYKLFFDISKPVLPKDHFFN